MERIRTTEVKQFSGQRVRVEGWLQSFRQMGSLNFLVIRDGWGQVQAVSETEAEVAPLIEGKIAVESVIAVEGQVISEAQAPGGVELHDLHIQVITLIQEPPPVPINKRKLTASIGTLLDQAVIMNRHPSRRAVLRLASGMMGSFRHTLTERGFTEIQTPKIVAAATESGASTFKLDYFGQPAFLAQSPQFYKQIMVGVFERVFEVGPVFRAEPHDTTRHINEYVSLDAECGFIKDHFTIMALLRDVIADILMTFNEHHRSKLDLLRVQMPVIPEQVPSIDFTEAQELIFKLHKVDHRGEPDLAPQDERWLGEWALKEFGSDFLYVTGYPASKRPFYTHPDPTRPAFTNTFDLLFRGTELVTGGQQRINKTRDTWLDYGKGETESNQSARQKALSRFKQEQFAFNAGTQVSRGNEVEAQYERAQFQSEVIKELTRHDRDIAGYRPPDLLRPEDMARMREAVAISLPDKQQVVRPGE